MDENLFRKCDMKEKEKTLIRSDDSNIVFKYVPCTRRFRLRAQDEISVDSIVSSLLAKIEPNEDQFKGLRWDVDAKDMLNEKQAILFEENLYISKLRYTNCKLNENLKVFLEHELEEVGNFMLNIEESYDGYVVFSKSSMAKGNLKGGCGHNLVGKYDNMFVLICEKRMEFDYVDKARIEKTLEARNSDDRHIVVRRSTAINNEEQKFKADINIQGREDIFILDGGVMLFMRYLVVNRLPGNYEYYTMNLFGKILRCVITVHEQRRDLRVFYRNFYNAVCVTNTQYFNDVAQESSETFFHVNGHIILHYWNQYNYVIHSTRIPLKPKEKLFPKLELIWKKDDLFAKKYKKEQKFNYDNAIDYLTRHPELSDFLYDFIISLLQFKPTNVLNYATKFFQNMKNGY